MELHRPSQTTPDKCIKMLPNFTRQDSLKAEIEANPNSTLLCSSTGAAVAPFHQDLHQANSPDIATLRNICLLIIKQSGSKLAVTVYRSHATYVEGVS